MRKGIESREREWTCEREKQLEGVAAGWINSDKGGSKKHLERERERGDGRWVVTHSIGREESAE